jgi:DNA repair protein RAD5
VIFSQFTSFLDLIEVVLKRERLDWYRFDGSMDIKKRSDAVSEFRSPSRKPKILIVSLKAGGVGLNVGLHLGFRTHVDVPWQLTTANHVFMVLF